MPLGFNENGTVSSYAPGVEPPGGRAVTVRQDEYDLLQDYIKNDLPLEDRILVVRGLVVKARKCRKTARKKRFRAGTQAAEAHRGALKYEAEECDRVARRLCEAWSLMWREEGE